MKHWALKRGPKPVAANTLSADYAQLQRNYKRLQQQIERAEAVIEIQKVALLVGFPITDDAKLWWTPWRHWALVLALLPRRVIEADVERWLHGQMSRWKTRRAAEKIAAAAAAQTRRPAVSPLH